MSIPAPFALVDVNFTSKTKYSLLLDSKSGYASLTYGPNFPGPGNASNLTPTGLANDGTSYTATITVDGTPISITVTGSAAQTFANLITVLNNGSNLNGAATAALVGDSIVITSATTGANSAVVIADSGTNLLFASIKGSTVLVSNGASPPVYTTTVYEFGLLTSTYKSVRGGMEYAVWNRLHASTQTIVAAAIDAFLASNPKTIATFGAITAGSGYTPGTYTGVALTGGTGTGATATIVVNGDGTVHAGGVTLVSGGSGYTVGDSLTNVLAGGGTLFAVAVATLTTTNTNTAWSSGVDYITLTPVGATTVGNATDTGLVTGSGTAAQTLANTTYNLNVNVNGAGAVNLAITLPILENVNTPVTFLHLVDSIEYALAAAGVPATAALIPGATNQIAITSNSVGTGSTVAITAGTSNNLLAYLGASNPAGFNFGAAEAGAAAGANGATNVVFPVTKTKPGILSYPTATLSGADEDATAGGKARTFTCWNDVMQFWPSTTGFGALWTTGTEAIVFKGKYPLAKGDAVRTAVYYNGTDWVYFDTGASVGNTGTTVAPPENV